MVMRGDSVCVWRGKEGSGGGVIEKEVAAVCDGTFRESSLMEKDQSNR